MMKIFALIFAMTIFMAFNQLTIAAEPIGRLFTSPAERSNLDYLRKTKKLNAQVKVEEPVETAEPAPIVLPNAVNLQGYVKRNDGKHGTIWVNNQALQENSGNKDVQVGRLSEDSNRVPIKLSANGKRLNLKAGQVYDPETNRVREARNHGAQGDSGTIGNQGF
ncbi:MAG: hypothetical protein WBL28_03545 [Methylotenera sp.]